jgi:hypothetical protein
MNKLVTLIATPMQSIEQFIKEYPDEWLAIDVTTEKEGRPKTGRLIYHAKNRDEVWRKTKNQRRVYIVYAGPALKQGYAAAF